MSVRIQFLLFTVSMHKVQTPSGLVGTVRTAKQKRDLLDFDLLSSRIEIN